VIHVAVLPAGCAVPQHSVFGVADDPV